MDHPNGASALAQCLLVSEQPDALAARLGAFGADPAGYAVLSADGFAGLFPGETPPPAPCMAGYVVAFADLDRAVRHIEGNGVAVRRDRLGRPFIGRASNNGAVMALIEDRRA